MRIPPRLAGVLLAALAAGPALAAWPVDTTVNVPLCRAPLGQQYPVGAASGDGAVFAWIDLRGGANFDIYAQRVRVTGSVDPAWPADGLAVCTANADQMYPAVLGDGAGGAFVVWCDGRGGTFDLYAQHVLAAGAPDPAWPAGGLLVCGAPSGQWFPVVTGDGGTGLLVAWSDLRSGDYDVYAQHVLATGALDPAWPAGGTPLCTAAGDQDEVRIVGDGAGGAVVAWTDRRGGTTADVYAQHVLATGAADPAWPAGGRALCAAPGNQLAPAAVSDGAGGAIVAWQDGRGGTGYDVYAAHVLATGALDPAWPADGRAACTATANQSQPVAVTDGAGGTVLAWTDDRSPAGADVYAAHVLATGALDPAWPADGRALCTAPESQRSPVAVADGAGGAIVAWDDARRGIEHDVYAQHVTGGGVPDPAWPADGLAVSTAAGDQLDPAIVAVPTGTGPSFLPLVAWDDDRDGQYDVYAQAAAPSTPGAPAPGVPGVADVRPDQGGRVTVSWRASGLDVAPLFGATDYRIWRQAPGAGWQVAATVPARAQLTYAVQVPTLADSGVAGPATHVFVIEARGDTTDARQHWFSAPDSGWSTDDLAPAPPGGFGGTFEGALVRLAWHASPEPDLAGYRLYRGAWSGFTPGPDDLVAETAATTWVDESGVPGAYALSAVDVHGNESGFALFLPDRTAGADGDALPALALARAGAHPSHGAVALRFVLPAAGHASLALFDPLGRRVRRVVDGTFAAGGHACTWDGRDDAGRRVPAGLYFARLEAAGGRATLRIVRPD